MIDKDLFILSWAHWEDYVPRFFIGPSSYTQEAFQALCESLMSEAVAITMAKVNNSEHGSSYIGWDDLMPEISKLLILKDFYEFTPKEAKFIGSGSLLGKQDRNIDKLGSAKDAVLFHNESVKHAMSQDLMGDDYLTPTEDSNI